MHSITVALLAFASLSYLASASVPQTDPAHPNVAAITETCRKLLRLSPEAWQRFRNSEFNDAAGTQCMVRCIGILLGMYTDETAIDMDFVARRSHGFENFDDFRAKYEVCAAAIKPEEYGNDYCKKSTRYFNCFYTIAGVGPVE